MIYLIILIALLVLSACAVSFCMYLQDKRRHSAGPSEPKSAKQDNQ